MYLALANLKLGGRLSLKLTVTDCIYCAELFPKLFWAIKTSSYGTTRRVEVLSAFNIFLPLPSHTISGVKRLMEYPLKRPKILHKTIHLETEMLNLNRQTHDKAPITECSIYAYSLYSSVIRPFFLSSPSSANVTRLVMINVDVKFSSHMPDDSTAHCVAL